MKTNRRGRYAIALFLLVACATDGTSPSHGAADTAHRKETAPHELGPDLGACGDGVLDRHESCDGPLDLSCAELDDRYSSGGAGCTDSCTWDYSDCGPAECGNGLHEEGEECDEGRTRNLCPDYGEECVFCLSSCTFGEGEPAFCGDEHLFFGEELCDPTVPLNCDDHGYESGILGCSDDCSEYDYANCVGSVCGNAIVEDGEDCDDGDGNTWECDYGDTDCEVCTPECTLAAGEVSLCGDGERDHEREDCDPPGSTDSARCPEDGVVVCSDLCKWSFDDCTSRDTGTSSDGSTHDVSSDPVELVEPEPATPQDRRGCSSTGGTTGMLWLLLGWAWLRPLRRRPA